MATHTLIPVRSKVKTAMPRVEGERIPGKTEGKAGVGGTFPSMNMIFPLIYKKKGGNHNSLLCV